MRQKHFYTYQGSEDARKDCVCDRIWLQCSVEEERCSKVTHRQQVRYVFIQFQVLSVQVYINSSNSTSNATARIEEKRFGLAISARLPKSSNLLIEAGTLSCNSCTFILMSLHLVKLSRSGKFDCKRDA